MRDGLERVSDIMEANTYRWSNMGYLCLTHIN
jgi:hypothetical protein